ncbi:MAG TPA: hypothetical protein VHF08_00180 [Nitrososphaeraceae archaeon]|nr:hypothetical protein [Nitrososphaeraceae archaeon]
MQSHFWIGSFCRCNSKGRYYFPRGTVATSDIITLVNDLGNRIPDKSWMLYLLEIFNSQNIACELNLICQFDDQDYFEAIFQGRNQYRFKEVLPLVGHSYQRQIILNRAKSVISYILTDKTANHTELFEFRVNNDSNNSKKSRSGFEALNQFTGIEWWNKVGSVPYPIRYHVEISQLLYGLNDVGNLDPNSILFRPYDALIPNSEGAAMEYPISFANCKIKDDGCISYDIFNGICRKGLGYS